MEQMVDVPRDHSIFRAKAKCVKPLKIRVVVLYDAVNLDKVCTAARIKPWLFGGYYGDVAEWLKAAVC